MDTQYELLKSATINLVLQNLVEDLNDTLELMLNVGVKMSLLIHRCE